MYYYPNLMATTALTSHLVTLGNNSPGNGWAKIVTIPWGNTFVQHFGSASHNVRLLFELKAGTHFSKKSERSKNAAYYFASYVRVSKF
jgi:hypothetical protein